MVLLSPATMEDPGSFLQSSLLQKLFQQSQKLQPTQPTSIIGIILLHRKVIFWAKKKRTKTWIVDSDAPDHMTGDANIFYIYNPYCSNYFVRIDDGSLSKVVGICSVTVSTCFNSSLCLAPNLDCNLLPISELTKDLQCAATLLANHCNFRLWNQGWWLTKLRYMRNSYLLLAEEYPPQATLSNIQPNSVSSIRCDNKNDVIFYFMD